MPKVSILTSARNSEAYLVDMIDSLLLANLSNWELVLVDDFSTDSTFQMAQLYASIHPNIIAIKNNRPGKINAYNIAFLRSTGDIIKFVDSDDVLLPYYLDSISQWHRYDAHIHNMVITSEELKRLSYYNVNPAFLNWGFLNKARLPAVQWIPAHFGVKMCANGPN
jgi:glycosyltransferase involved in cell wall biosynthesis